MALLPARRSLSRSRTAGTCGTTWASTRRRPSPRTAAASPALLTAGTTDSAPSGQAPAAPPPEPDGLRDVCGRERALVSRTLERHAAVHELLREGRSQREAADILGLDRKTVGRFAAEADPGRLLVKATGRAGKLDPF